MNQEGLERIAKVMARRGVCSRRDAEQWITEGRVKVNGEVLIHPSAKVHLYDDIQVDDQSISLPCETSLWLYHKPRGVITTHKDPEGRPSVFNALPKYLPRVISIGRLDVNSEGLLLLTNDGSVARFFELPKTRLPRTYRVRVFGHLPDQMVSLLQRGLTINGVYYGSIEAQITERKGSNIWLTLTLYEGKNREIRNIIRYFNLSLSRLIRIGYGPFTLDTLLPEQVYKVPNTRLRHELENLKYYSVAPH